MAEACAPYPFFFIHPSMQALRRKMTVAELGQLSPLSLKSPPCFFSASQWLFELFRQAKHTHKHTNRYTDSFSATALATFFPRRLIIAVATMNVVIV